MNLKKKKLTHTKIYAIAANVHHGVVSTVVDPLFRLTMLRGTFLARPILLPFGAAFFLCGIRGILIYTRIVWYQ